MSERNKCTRISIYFFNRRLFLALFFILLSPSFSQAQIKTPLFNPSSLEDYTHPSARPKHYLLADSVVLRKSNNRNSTAIDLMRIGQAFVIDDRSTEIDTINGIIAHWYRISYANRSGYIWGGFIALKAMGSHSQSGVRFYYGLSRENDTGKYTSYLAQIRAVNKQGQILDKREFIYNPSLYLPQHDGACGLALDDIFFWHLPCEGGCGCTTGEYYLFWNGAKFSELYSALGTADAWASGGSRFIFPSDMEGEPDLIIRQTDDFIDDRPEGYLRYWSKEYFKILNGEMVKADKPSEREEYYSKN